MTASISAAACCTRPASPPPPASISTAGAAIIMSVSPLPGRPRSWPRRRSGLRPGSGSGATSRRLEPSCCISQQEDAAMTNQDHDIEVLNNLISLTLDSAHGYEDASGDTKNPHFKTLFGK